MSKDSTNMEMCPCCGQMRPYPTEAGIWEYLQYPVSASRRPEEYTWQRARIVVSTGKEHHEVPLGELLFYKGRSKKLGWWPDNSKWRKIK